MRAANWWSCIPILHRFSTKNEFKNHILIGKPRQLLIINIAELQSSQRMVLQHEVAFRSQLFGHFIDVDLQFKYWRY